MKPGDLEWSFGVRERVARLVIQRPAELKYQLFLLDCEAMDHLDEAMGEWPPEVRRAAQEMWVS